MFRNLIYALAIILSLGGSQSASASDQKIDQCVAKFSGYPHTDAAGTTLVCSCLVAHFPQDKVEEAAEYLRDKENLGEKFLAHIAWWMENSDTAGRTAFECGLKSCGVTPGSLEAGCAFHAAWMENHWDHRAAVEWYSRHIAADPKTVSAFGNRGRAYLDLGQYDLAIADFEHFVSVARLPHDGYSLLARAYHLAGRDDDALKAADIVISTQRPDSRNYRSRAEIYESLGRKEAAIADYREIIRMKYSFSEDQMIAKAALTRLGEQ